MALVLDSHSLKQLGDVFDNVCHCLGGRKFSRDQVAKQMLQHVAGGVEISDLLHHMLHAAPLSYTVKLADRWQWQLHYRGTVVRSGAEDSSVGARSAAMLAAASFRLH